MDLYQIPNSFVPSRVWRCLHWYRISSITIETNRIVRNMMIVSIKRMMSFINVILWWTIRSFWLHTGVQRLHVINNYTCMADNDRAPHIGRWVGYSSDFVSQNKPSKAFLSVCQRASKNGHKITANTKQMSFFLVESCTKGKAHV